MKRITIIILLLAIFSLAGCKSNVSLDNTKQTLDLINEKQWICRINDKDYILNTHYNDEVIKLTFYDYMSETDITSSTEDLINTTNGLQVNLRDIKDNGSVLDLGTIKIDYSKLDNEKLTFSNGNNSFELIKQDNIEEFRKSKVLEEITIFKETFIYSYPSEDHKTSETIKPGERIDLFEKTVDEGIEYGQIAYDKWIKLTDLNTIDWSKLNDEEIINLISGKHFTAAATYMHGDEKILVDFIIEKVDSKTIKILEYNGYKSEKVTFVYNQNYVQQAPSYEDLFEFGYTSTNMHYTFSLSRSESNNDNVVFYASSLSLDGPAHAAMRIESKMVNVGENAIDSYGGLSNEKGKIIVNVDGLRIRSFHSTSSDKVANANKGDEYVYYEIYQDEQYTWYRLGIGWWVANDGTWLTVIPN